MGRRTRQSSGEANHTGVAKPNGAGAPARQFDERLDSPVSCPQEGLSRSRRQRSMAGTMAKKTGLLQGARVYLSGPMDFVASRADEKKYGWRNRVGEFLEAMGVTVFDPWFKPDVRGLLEYGREDVKSGDKIKDRWTYEVDKKGAE